MRLAETKYTPGPWRIHRNASTAVEAPSIGNVIANCGGWGDTTKNQDEVIAQMEANAQLIAAAPEMAEALLDCLNMVDGDGCPPDWDKVRTILQKAGLL